MTSQEVAASEQDVLFDPEAIVRDLDAGFTRLPKAALRACQANRELMAPRLIHVLEETLRLGREGTVREGNAHFFALFLLAEFQAKEALPVVLEFFSLRDPVLESLIGGAITETTFRVLAVLGGDQPDLIESLISNHQLDDFVRWGAASSFCAMVRDGRISRDEAIERLTRQLLHAIGIQDWWGVTIVVSELGELNPLEVQDLIREAFDKDLVDESIIDWSCFEDYLLHPDCPGTCPELSEKRSAIIVDTVEELGGWYAFSEERNQQRRSTLLKSDNPTEEEGSHESPPAIHSDEIRDQVTGTVRHAHERVGRNDLCPCGSGKKFKKCCLRE